MNNSTALTIAGSSVRQVNGLYSLNDLHKASGGEENFKPAFFLRNDQAQALVAEIAKGADLHLFLKSTKGRNGGTFACKELVIAYAAWISAAFHLKVIRVFLSAATQQHEPVQATLDYDRISPAQAQDLKEIVEAIVKAGIQNYAETWRRLQNKFKVNSYLALNPGQYEAARSYLIAKLPDGYCSDVVDPISKPKSNAPDIGLAFTIAAEAAAKVQRAVFDSAMSGAPDWKHGRYLLSVGAHAQQIEPDAFVLPIDRLPGAIEASTNLDAQTLMQLASACMTKLGHMAQSTAASSSNLIEATA